MEKTKREWLNRFHEDRVKSFKEWLIRLYETEVKINGEAAEVPIDQGLLNIKQKLVDSLIFTFSELLIRMDENSLSRYEDRFKNLGTEIDEKTEEFRKSYKEPLMTQEGLQKARKIAQSPDWKFHNHKLIETFNAFSDLFENPDTETIDEPRTVAVPGPDFLEVLIFLSFYFNFLVPDAGFTFPGIDGRFSLILSEMDKITNSLVLTSLHKGKQRDRITDSKQSLAAKRAELKRAVFYAYKTLRGKDENNKLRKKVDFVEKIERELNGPGYFTKFKKPPSSRSIVRFLDELTAEGRIHPPWKKSQT